MNKFLTIAGAVLLVLPTQGIGLETVSPAPEALAAPPPVTAGGRDLPMPLQQDRYATLGKKSPFTLASTTEEAPDFAKDLILGGYVRLDGEEYVMVANRTKPDRILVGKKAAPAAQGMTLIKITKDPAGDSTKMTAQIKKNSELATIKYETAAPSAAPVGQPPQAVPPGMPQIPGAVNPQQRVQGQGAPGQPGQNKGNPAPVIRRRVIPIPTSK